LIPYGRQEISQEDIDSVIRVLKSDFITQGPQVPRFEKSVADYCHADFGIALNSATSALHIACLALGLGKGDSLWTSPNSFVASANCGLYCGAQVDFVDIDKKTYNISIPELEKKLAQAKINNKIPKIIIPVHFAGQSCDMKKLDSLRQEYGFKIIEDASHAIGGKYLDNPVGSCKYSDATVFSFHPVKIITTAEGGLVTTNNQEIADQISLLRAHGITKDSRLMSKEVEGGWYYEQIDLGYNYRMTELQAALGISQMERLDEFVSKRHALFKRYNSLLHKSINKPYQLPDSYSSLHLYPIQVPQKVRKKVFNELRKGGIGVQVHYIPIHSQPFYKKLGFMEGDFPNSENYYKRSISIPLYAGLDFKLQDEVINVINETLDKI
jgi:UDP-4-amino-4,6-dideoxy-N-acetyl-beta-L-altrosamine transaminase